MKNIAVGSRVKVCADGHGVVSHAGMALVRELADRSGLSAQVTAALADTYRGPWVHAPGEVFADLAVAVADGAVAAAHDFSPGVLACNLRILAIHSS